MKGMLGYILAAILIFFVIAYNIEENHKEKNEEAKKEKEMVKCQLCGDDLTDTYNRMTLTGEGYYCMDCYHKLTKGSSNSMLSEDYIPANSNDYESEASTDSGEEYSLGSDGGIHDNAPCELCGGSGTEMTYNDRHEYIKTLCRACNGEGHIIH